jgi:phosphoserine aminotransferase
VSKYTLPILWLKTFLRPPGSQPNKHEMKRMRNSSTEFLDRLKEGKLHMVKTRVRLRMNISVTFKSSDTEKYFFEEADKRGMMQSEVVHCRISGIQVSLYK